MPTAVFTPVDWSTIQWYQPSDFSHPEKLEDSVVRGVDRLATYLGQKAVILSDFRVVSAISKSQHGLGRAIDLAYPDIDSMQVLHAIKNLNWFGGYGMYVNPAGIVSFHVDTRTDRSPESPATWGARKEAGQTEWVYNSLRSIIDLVRPHALPLGWVALMLVAIFFLARKS